MFISQPYKYEDTDFKISGFSFTLISLFTRHFTPGPSSQQNCDIQVDMRAS